MSPFSHLFGIHATHHYYQNKLHHLPTDKQKGTHRVDSKHQNSKQGPNQNVTHDKNVNQQYPTPTKPSRVLRPYSSSSIFRIETTRRTTATVIMAETPYKSSKILSTSSFETQHRFNIPQQPQVRTEQTTEASVHTQLKT